MTKEQSSVSAEKDLLVLVNKWQETPKEYTELLVKHVYETLYLLGSHKIKTSKVESKYINSSATSIVLECQTHLIKGSDDKFLSLQHFYEYLRKIVRSILIERYKHVLTVEEIENTKLFKQGSIFEQDSSINIIDLDNSLVQLKQIDPDAAQALFINFYNSKNVEQIAYIMNKPVKTIEMLLEQGKMVLKALLRGAQLTA